jgi:hypothetical protein
MHKELKTMTSTKTLARVAGLLYLLVAVTTGIAGHARGSLVVAGDPAATAAHIRASETLFRVGIVADLASATLFLLTAIALYALLGRVDRLAAGAMVTFVAVSVAIQALNLVNELVALSLATGQAYPSGLGQTGSDALTLLFVDLQHDGFVISQMFFAMWLLPLGYLVVRSGWFPRVLGHLLVVACVGYLVDLFVYFLAPDIEGSILPFSAAAGAIGELGFIAWLLVNGARVADGDPGAPETNLELARTGLA